MRRGLFTAAAACALASCAPRVQPPAPPGTPTLSIVETDGGSNGLLHLRGEAPGAVAVRLFASAACHGVPLAVVSAAGFFEGVEVQAVPGPNVFTGLSVGQTGAPSACSAPVRATFSGGDAVAAPRLRRLIPASPAAATHVVVDGSAPPGCGTVALHVDGCSAGPAALTVSAAALEQGVGLDVPPGIISSIVATCEAPSLARPSCSNALYFVSAPATLPSPTWSGLSPSSPSSDPDPQVTVSVTVANAVEVYDGPCDGGVRVGSSGGTFPTSAFGTATLNVRAALSGAAEQTQLWLRTLDEAGDASRCTPGPGYQVDPSLPPRATRVFLYSSGPDAVQLEVDAQRGGEVDIRAGPDCKGPLEAVVVSTGVAEVLWVPRALPDGGRTSELSYDTRFDGGVSPCARALF